MGRRSVGIDLPARLVAFEVIVIAGAVVEVNVGVKPATDEGGDGTQPGNQ